MAYQNVFTPRFYIDYLSYWHSIGMIEAIVNNGGDFSGNPLGLDPATPFTISGEPNTNGDFIFGVDLKDIIPERSLESINYVGLFGHTLGNLYTESATGVCFRIKTTYKETGAVGEWGTQADIGRVDQMWGDQGGADDIINSTYFGGSGHNSVTRSTIFEENSSGFSLFKADHNQATGQGQTSSELLTGVNRFIFEIKQFAPSVNYGIGGAMTDYGEINPLWNLNSIAIGHYYDMPHSPDLDLKMEIEFDGYDQVETIGGSTLTNVRYQGNPKWNDMNCWEIGTSSPFYKRNGRRVWNLKFSFISDKDLFASNYSSNDWLSNTTDNSGYDSADLTADGNNFEYTLADDDSFISKVLNYVGNGQKFIFQPDSNNNNPDQFAICILDQDSLNISQKSFKAYEFSLKIREVW
jgi:hypothetical protein